ncbi:MAG TPA: NosD domain-containing protein, partial [Candidatus Nanoarchaeia archaeon]|nr:NosD domain-containing protein [Candidatus Nanoarchaeia archaeon]
MERRNNHTKYFKKSLILLLILGLFFTSLMFISGINTVDKKEFQLEKEKIPPKFIDEKVKDSEIFDKTLGERELTSLSILDLKPFVTWFDNIFSMTGNTISVSDKSNNNEESDISISGEDVGTFDSCTLRGYVFNQAGSLMSDIPVHLYVSNPDDSIREKIGTGPQSGFYQFDFDCTQGSSLFNVTAFNSTNYGKNNTVASSGSVTELNITIDSTWASDTSSPIYSMASDNSDGVVLEGTIVSVSVYWEDRPILEEPHLDVVNIYENSSGIMNLSTNLYLFEKQSGWANGTISTSGDVGKTICWRQSANDTLDNQNDTMPNNKHCFKVVSELLPPTIELISPGNNSKGVSIPAILNVTVSDPEGQDMDVSFYDNTTGTPQLLNTSYNVPNGSYANYSWDGLDSATTYNWYANVTDGKNRTISQEWNFTTSYDITSCQEISSPGTYVLQNDINPSGGIDGNCFTITSEDVVLEGNSYEIIGDGDSSGTGISVNNVKNVTIKDFKNISGFYYGINPYRENTITNNIANLNGFAGIMLSTNHNNTITNNTANSNTVGIYIYEQSENNTILGNNFKSNDLGVGIYSYSTNNIIKNNTISLNSGGIGVEGNSSYNSIYNNIINNSDNVNFSNGNRQNFWNNSLKGNLWTNPSATGFSDNCTDSNSDGTCDSVYDVYNDAEGCSSDNCDYLPQAKIVGQNPGLNSAPNQPILNSPEPSGVDGVSMPVILNVTVTDDDGDDMNVSFYDNTTGTPQLLNISYNVTDGSYANYSWDGLDSATTYNWYANITDGKNITISQEWNFTTASPSVTYSKVNDTSGEFNEVVEGANVDVFVYWESIYELDKAEFYTNETSIMEKKSLCDLSGYSGWCNKTIDTTGHQDEVICWKQYANDTLGNVNNSMQNTDNCFSVVPPAPEQTIKLIRPENDSEYVSLPPTLEVEVTDNDGDNMSVSFYEYVGGEEWTQYRSDLQNTGYTSNTGPDKLTLQSSYSTSGNIKSSPAISNGYVYIGSDDNNVYKLNATTMEHVANYSTNGDVKSSPAIANGYVYVGEGSGNTGVYKLNATTMEHVANYSTGGTVYSSPAISNGYVYIGCYGDDNVYKLNATTMEHVANNSVGGGGISDIAISNGYVYRGSDDNSTYILNATTMEHVANYSTNGDISSSPAIANGYVYIGSDDGSIYKLGEKGHLLHTEKGVENGTSTSYLWEGLDGGTTYDWYANVTDGNTYTISRTWNFTTINYRLSACQEINQPGYYTLQNNITGISGTCFNITSDEVTLDGNGYGIEGDGDSTGTGVFADLITNISLKNFGNISKFEYGIYFSNASNIAIENNTISLNDHSGIYLDSSSESNIENNIAINSEVRAGIYLDSSSKNNIESNMVSYNMDYGITLRESHNNTILNNTANYNPGNEEGHGIQLSYSHNNTILNNTASYNGGGEYDHYGTGIELRYSNNSEIDSNILSNQDFGLSIENSFYNMIYNNFLNNSENVAASGINDWNNSVKGNYYTNSSGNGFSDTCEDNNPKDGICDSPLVFNENNIDYKPLSQWPYEEFVNTAPNNITDPNNPSDGEEDVILNPELNITAIDVDGHNMTVEFYNSTGLINTKHNVKNNSYVTYTWSGLHPGDTYFWRVNISDGINSTITRYWNFTTNDSAFLPAITLVSPEPNATDGIEVNPVLNVTITEPWGGGANVTFYNITGDEKQILHTVYDVSNLGYANYTWEDLQPGTTYNWGVNVSNDVGMVNKTFQFTTSYNPNVTDTITINESGSQGGDVSRGDSVRINATINDTDGLNDIDKVWVKIWKGVVGSSYVFQGFLTNIADNLWSILVETDGSFTPGESNYTIYVNDTTGNQVNYSDSFNLTNTAPDKPVLNYPENNSNYIHTNTTLNVTVRDKNNDTM